MEATRQAWELRVGVHRDSAFYDLAGFRAGASTLTPVEREDLPDLAGRSLLHLQCHFGMDTLSMARMGARVTGMDFSEEARSEEHTSELQSQSNLVCRLLLEKKTRYHSLAVDSTPT